MADGRDLNSRARGIRGYNQQWFPLTELWQELRVRYPRLSFNDFAWILWDLGKWVFEELPDGLRQQMLAPHKVFTKREKQRMKIQTYAQRLARSELRIDDKLSLGLPFHVKATIRREAAQRKMRMSPYVRQRLGIKLEVA